MKGFKLSLFLLVCLLLTQATEAHPSWGIVIDKDKNIYFADILHNGRGSVWKLSHDGKLELLFKDFHAHNVSLDDQQNLITAHGEMDEHFMLRLKRDGSLDTLIESNDYKSFNGGCCTYSPNQGVLFNAQGHIWRLSKSGEKKKISEHHFAWSQTIYADEEGNVFAPEIGDGKGKLIRIDPGGNAKVIANNLISQLDRPYDKHADVLMGISKDKEGRIYIAELAGQRIISIQEGGQPETYYRSEGDWMPTGINFFAGEAYILEYKEKNGHAGPRITKVDESGNRTELFNYDTYQQKEDETSPIMEPSGDSKGGKWTFLFIGIGLLITVAIASRLKNYLNII